MATTLQSGLSDVLTLKEAAKLLKLHPVTVREKAASHEIPGKKIGRVWRFRRSILEQWMDGSVQSSPALHSHSGGTQ